MFASVFSERPFSARPVSQAQPCSIIRDLLWLRPAEVIDHLLSLVNTERLVSGVSGGGLESDRPPQVKEEG